MHDCFWHGHKNCKYFVAPKTRTKWWVNKIKGNIANDSKTAKALRKEGWKIILVWGCALKPVKVEKAVAPFVTAMVLFYFLSPEGAFVGRKFPGNTQNSP